jgi:uncharacterized protein (UPF0264 family)
MLGVVSGFSRTPYQLARTEGPAEAGRCVYDSHVQLLVSVSSPSEAAAALAGGADVIDAKDPLAGALGAVAPAVLREIRRVVGGTRTLSAAIGDASSYASAERDALACRTGGATFVKLGFSGIGSADRAVILLEAAVRGAPAGVIAVAYADSARAGSPTPDAMVDAATRAGTAGILLDTADKDGPGLRALFTAEELAAWTRAAHAAGLLVAVAGKLTASDLLFARDSGADIAGVRGAACEGGRMGHVSVERVRLLRACCG